VAKVPRTDAQVTAQEIALARVINRAVKSAWNSVDERELALALRNLDADKVNQIVKSLSIKPSDAAIVKQLSSAVRERIDDTVTNIRRVLSGQNKLRPKPVTVLNEEAFRGIQATGLPNLLRPVATDYTFNYTDPRAMLFATTRAANLVTAVDQSTQIAIRQIIGRSFTDQVTVRQTAKILKNVVGLHPRWANAVYDFNLRAYNDLLDQGLTPSKALDKADDLTTKYHDRLVSARASMIARTEIQTAQNQGRYLGWTQASEQGLIDGATTKMWLTSPLDPCDICQELSGEVVQWNQSFSGGFIVPPAHPNCRCVSVLIPPDRGTIEPEPLIDEFVSEF